MKQSEGRKIKNFDLFFLSALLAPIRVGFFSPCLTDKTPVWEMTIETWSTMNNSGETTLLCPAWSSVSVVHTRLE